MRRIETAQTFLTAAEVDELVGGYLAGPSIEELAERYGIHRATMLMAGRRCLLLKGSSIVRMPTDLFGFIYKSVDLDEPATITAAVHEWAREDLALGKCESCSNN